MIFLNKTLLNKAKNYTLKCIHMQILRSLMIKKEGITMHYS
jgi:hypothetical protein